MRFVSLLGLLALVGLCFLLSRNRRAVSWRLVGMGLLIQAILGGLFLYWGPGNRWLQSVGQSVKQFLQLGERGTHFVFGDLGKGSSEFDLMLMTSADGSRFAPAGMLGNGAAPTMVALDGDRVLAAYLNVLSGLSHGYQEVVTRVLASDPETGAPTWSPPRALMIDGLPDVLQAPFDPHLVEVGDGGLRLFFTAYRGSGRGARAFAASGWPATYSARSGDGGVSFVFEPGVRFGVDGERVLHPTVVEFGGKWHYYAPVEGKPGTGYHAVSDDGLSFRRVDDVKAPGPWRGSAVVVDSELLFFGTGGDHGWAGRSGDGETFATDPALRRAGHGPAVVRRADGSFLMARSAEKGLGFVFATQILPTLIFFSAVMGVLYYLGIMQAIVRVMAIVMARLLGTSGAESLSACGNVFVGQTEAPLLVRPFLAKMTSSELHAIMTGGYATIAGGVFALYVGFGVDAGHLMVASVMAAPAGLVCSKILWPETEHSETMGKVVVSTEKNASNVVEAAANGSLDGLKLALNVGAMLIAFLGLVAVLDWILEIAGGWFGLDGLSVGVLLGWLFSPIAAVMGVPGDEILILGQLLGTKIALTELVAYSQLGGMVAEGAISPRTTLIASFALCGFANLGSVAIQIGGLGAMAPERKPDLARLAFRAMFAGALATCMTACLAGVLSDV